MVIHAEMHWPGHVDTHLCPFAMDHAVWIWNKLPNKESGYIP